MSVSAMPVFSLEFSVSPGDSKMNVTSGFEGPCLLEEVIILV